MITIVQRNKAIKIVLKVVCFIAIFVFLLLFIGKFFVPYSADSTRQSASFYNMQRDSIDVLIVGSSSVFVGITPLELCKDYGISAYTRGSSTQAPAITYMNIKEAYKYQNPKFVIMGVSSLFYEYDVDEYEGPLMRGTEDKKFSMEKIEVAKYIAENSEKQKSLNYIFPIFYYHDRWKSLTARDISNKLHIPYDYMRGQFTVYEINSIEPRDIVHKTDKEEKFNEDSWAWYEKAIDYCNEQGTEVIVVYMPTKNWSYGRYLTIKQLMDSKGVEYLDFNLENMLENINVNWDTDFYNEGHVNLIGAEKITDYIGQYIIDNYSNINWHKIEGNEKQKMEEDFLRYEKDLNGLKKQAGL